MALSDEQLRALAIRRGKEFVEFLRRMFSDVPFEGIQVVSGPSGTYFIQRHRGRVVGGAFARDGYRTMIAGGKVVGSPVSAKPIYAAMNKLGIRPSERLSPF